MPEEDPTLRDIENASLAINRITERGKPMVQLSILTDENEVLAAMQFTPEKARAIGKLIDQTANTMDVKGTA